MKKIILITVLLLSSGLLSTVHAFTTEVIEDTGDTITYNIIANPPEKSSGIQLRAKVSGGIITDVRSATQKYIPMGMCSNQQFFNQNELCVDFGLIGDYESAEVGDTLLVVSISREVGSDIEFTPEDDYGYLNFKSELVSENGLLIQDFGSPNNNTQNENFSLDEQIVPENENSSLPLYLLVAVLAVLVVAFVVVMIVSNKNDVVSVKRSES